MAGWAVLIGAGEASRKAAQPSSWLVAAVIAGAAAAALAAGACIQMPLLEHEEL